MYVLNTGRIFELFFPLLLTMSDILLMTLTKCTIIYYTCIQCSSYIFRCVAHHHQGELVFFLHKNILILYSYYLHMNSGCVMKYKGYAYGILMEDINCRL